ncbi:MAG: hypothetical protein DRP60_04895 [Spirochaetes bacterium]|nr:MAG: hypothetical protein DRP60_04895 [Spirochaetota bacterium]
MEKNTLENNIHDPDRWDMSRLDKELDFEILEEIPEVKSVEHSTIFQLFFLPILALVIIAVIPITLSFIFNNQREIGIAGNTPFTSLENPLLLQAAEEINDKRREVDLRDIQIRHYQNRVLEMDNKLQILQGVMEESLQVRESTLLEENSRTLEKERARLEASGQSREQINQALNILKADLDAIYNDKMEEFRLLEMTAYKRRLTNLQYEKTSLEENLNTAVKERQALAENLDSDETELLAQLYQEENFLDIINAGIDKDLEILKETKKVENYWLNELANQYLRLIDAITTRNYEMAQTHLDTLENLFSDSAAARLPGISIRNEADRELVRFFSAYLASLKKNDLSALIAESKLLVDLAVTNLEAGRYQEADINWRQLTSNWSLMDQVTKGYLKTYSELIALEVTQFTRLSKSSLLSGDYQEASSSWMSGLEQIPAPVGNELMSFWQLWESTTNKRLEEKDLIMFTALAIEKEDSAARYEQLNRQLERVSSERDEAVRQTALAVAANTAANTAAAAAADKAAETAGISETARSVDSEKLSAAEVRISTLEDELTDLKNRLIESEAALKAIESSTPVAASQWHLYGIIVQVRGETLVVEPLTNQIPPGGSEIRVMHSLGQDRVIHLADGSIVQANATRATCRILSDSDGAEIYGTPKVDDLIYISAY